MSDIPQNEHASMVTAYLDCCNHVVCSIDKSTHQSTTLCGRSFIIQPDPAFHKNTTSRISGIPSFYSSAFSLSCEKCTELLKLMTDRSIWELPHKYWDGNQLLSSLQMVTHDYILMKPPSINN